MAFETVRLDKRNPTALILLPLLVLAIVDSVLLTHVHYKAIAESGRYKSFCTFSKTVDCTAVVFTPYSHVLGLPICVLGLTVYLGLTAFLIKGLLGHKETFARAMSLLFICSVLSFCYSVYLAYISSFVIHRHCVLCYGLHLLNTLLLIATYFLVRRSGVGIGETVRWEIKSIQDNRNVAFGLLGLVIFSLVGAYYLRNARRENLVRTDDYLARIFDGTAVRATFPTDGMPSIGPEDAPIEIVEFNDFECPFCRESVRNMEKVFNKYPDKIRQVFVNFPVDRTCNPAVAGTLHENACRLASAGRAFYKEGKFWEFHKKAFRHYGEWDFEKDLDRIAEKLGVDVNKIRVHISDPATEEEIKVDITHGYNLELEGTPGFLVNGLLVQGNLDTWVWERIIDFELKRLEAEPLTIPTVNGSRKRPETEAEKRLARFLDRSTDLKNVFVGVGPNKPAPYQHVPMRGPKEAVLDIRVFFDFLCPLSRKAAHTLDELTAKYPDDVRLSFVNFPADKKCNPTVPQDIRPGSCNLAYNGRVFFFAGKFWEFYDYAFKHEGKWLGSDVINLAENLGITQEYLFGNIPWTKTSIETELTWSQALQFTGSPCFVVNGVCLRTDIPLEIWESILQMEKARQKQQKESQETSNLENR